jgi:hypothetical protein
MINFHILVVELAMYYGNFVEKADHHFEKDFSLKKSASLMPTSEVESQGII